MAVANKPRNKESLRAAALPQTADRIDDGKRPAPTGLEYAFPKQTSGHSAAFLVHGRCVAHSRPGLLRTPPAALADKPPHNRSQSQPAESYTAATVHWFFPGPIGISRWAPQDTRPLRVRKWTMRCPEARPSAGPESGCRTADGRGSRCWRWRSTRAGRLAGGRACVP